MFIKWTVVTLLLIAAFFSFTLYLAVGGNTNANGIFGNWEGDFVETKSDAKVAAGGRLHGYLQIYNTHDTFKLRLGNKLQQWDVSGNWKLEGERLLLNIVAVDLSQEAEDDLGIKQGLISGDDVRKGYGKVLIFALSKDHKEIQGLPMSLGKVEGSHHFVKALGSSYINKK